MKRDMDLARRILLWMEEHQGTSLAPRQMQFDGYTEDQIGYHCHLLDQAGLIKAADATAMDNEVPVAIPISLTWAGHEFIDASRDSTLWAKAKEKVIAPAGGAAFSLLLEWLKAEAKQRLGLP